eukprot:COSAG05_NODE_1974_length_3765_cov_19.906983_5_plen_53_part_00
MGDFGIFCDPIWSNSRAAIVSGGVAPLKSDDAADARLSFSLPLTAYPTHTYI